MAHSQCHTTQQRRALAHRTPSSKLVSRVPRVMPYHAGTSQQRSVSWRASGRRSQFTRTLHRRAIICTALGDSGGATPEELAADSKLEKIVFLPSGDVVSLTSRKRTELWPELAWGREECLEKQLVALANNNQPYVDHGIEVMYRFAAFDPFNPRTTYFGKVFDLGQFERFRRIMRTPPYATLLGHQNVEMLSSLEVSENVWVARVAITGAPHGDVVGDQGVFEFTLVQRLGGVHDGYWFTQSLVADGNDWQFMKGGNPHRI